MITAVRVPKTDVNELECRIVVWHKHEGDLVAADDPLFEIETDKAVVVVTSEEAGVLRRIDIPAEEVARVGEVAGYIGSPDDELPPAATRVPAPTTSPALPARPAAAPPGLVRASAAARRLAAELRVDLAAVAAGVEGGIVHVEAVQGFAESRRQAAGEPRARRERLSHAQVVLGQRLQAAEAQRVSGRLLREVNVTPVLAHLREESVAAQCRLSLLDAAVYVCARTLPRHPLCNATRDREEVVLYEELNIGLAMTLGDRLVVPVIRQADALSLREVALAKTGSWLKLTRGQLTPNDWQGGTFTIAELGSGEVDAHFPIINDRQSAILGFGQVAPRCYPEGDEVRIGRFVTFTLTFDHTLMNGDYAARFLDGVIRGLIALGAQTSSDPDVPAITTQGCHDS